MISAKDKQLITDIVFELIKKSATFSIEPATIHDLDDLRDAYTIKITHCTDLRKLFEPFPVELFVEDGGVTVWPK